MMGFFKKSIHTTFFKFVEIAISFICSVIIAKELGAYKKGILSGVLLVPWLVVLIGNLGVDVSNLYYTANKKRLANIYFVNTLLITIVISVIFIPAGLLLFKFLKNSLVLAPYLLFALILIPVSLLSKYLAGILVGFNEVEKNNLVFFYKNLAYLTLIFFMWLINGLTIERVMITMIFIEIVSITAYILFLRQFFKIHLSFGKKNITEFKKSFPYGFKAYLANIFSFLNYKVDMFLIMKFLNPIFLGVYSITSMIAERIWLFPSILSSVLLPHIANYKDSNITSFLSRLVFAGMVILIILLIIFLKPLIILFYGKEFAGAYTPFLYLVPGILFLSVGKLVTSDLIGRGYTKYTMKSSLIAAIINIVLNFFLIPIYKLNGAALASTISYSFNSFYLIYIYSKLTGTKLSGLFLIRKSDFLFLFTYRKRILWKK